MLVRFWRQGSEDQIGRATVAGTRSQSLTVNGDDTSIGQRVPVWSVIVLNAFW